MIRCSQGEFFNIHNSELFFASGFPLKSFLPFSYLPHVPKFHCDDGIKPKGKNLATFNKKK